MHIEERSVGDVVVLDLKGKITLGEGDELLKDKVNSLVNQGHRKILLNFADVPYVDSAGLGEVVRTYTTVSRQGGSLKLLNLTKRITDLLAITKLLTVFETFDAESDALKLFLNTKALAALSARSKAELVRKSHDQLTFELIHNMVVEMTRLGIEVRNLAMRVESMQSRLEFNERRARALESAVVYKPSEPQAFAEPPSPPVQEMRPAEEVRPQ